MKQYKILIVGIRCYSGHIREFVVNLKKNNPLASITLITSDIQDEFRDDVSKNVERVVIVKRCHDGVKPKQLVAIMNIFYLLFGFFKLYINKHFDIVNIHYASAHLKYAMPIIKRMANNIVISPWGSDVMRVEGRKKIKELTKLYSQVNYVTVSKESQIGQCLISKFNVSPERMVKLGWGGDFFDFIHEHFTQVTTETAKTRFGLDNRFVITCGYNTNPSQRHEIIVNQIYKIKDQLPQNLTLLFPFTYPKSAYLDKYISTVIEKSETLGFDVVVVDEHLDMMDLLKLRMATDVFVHVQESDAGSRCVMEYVYCNKKIVHGAWMKYVYLDQYRPSCYFPVEKMEDLGTVIVKACQTIVEDLPEEVKTMILDRGWNNRMPRWNAFFESLIS